MTMPHLENCRHSEEGWCLNCVKQQWLELDACKQHEKGSGCGMSLLDYFAGQALANSSICHINQSPAQAARMAYVQADAMLSYKQNQQLAAESQQVALGIGKDFT